MLSFRPQSTSTPSEFALRPFHWPISSLLTHFHCKEHQFSATLTNMSANLSGQTHNTRLSTRIHKSIIDLHLHSRRTTLAQRATSYRPTHGPDCNDSLITGSKYIYTSMPTQWTSPHLHPQKSVAWGWGVAKEKRCWFGAARQTGKAPRGDVMATTVNKYRLVQNFVHFDKTQTLGASFHQTNTSPDWSCTTFPCRLTVFNKRSAQTQKKEANSVGSTHLGWHIPIQLSQAAT